MGTDEETPFTGSGCFGRLELLLEPLTPPADGGLATLGSEIEAERRVGVATVIATDLPQVRLGARVLTTIHVTINRIVDDTLAESLTDAATAALAASDFGTAVIASDGSSALVEVIEPPPHLFIFGAGADAVPLVHFAALLGWNVTVCATAARPQFRDRFMRFARVSERSLRENVYDLNRCARPLAVIMSHDYQRDRAALGALVDSSAHYVGVLGPARRTERMLLEIESEHGALSVSQKSRVFAPVGLALGAETPQEIALSIVAEAQASLARAPRGSLRESNGTIHAPLAPALHGEFV
jgi:xanthine/CO dehydrogenase XdhC/CoxF family maturation factor